MSTRLVCLSQRSGGNSSQSKRIFVSKDDLAGKNLSLLHESGVLECVILSTCIRFEIYAVVKGVSDFLKPLRKYLEVSHGLNMNYSDGSFSIFEGEDAVRHLFAVVCGLDSRILGEKQIVGQIRHAYGTALELGCTGPLLNRIFQKSLNVSKKIRTKTGIDRGACSAASLAVRFLLGLHGSLRSKRVLILGAGQMGKLVGLHLSSKGCKNICFASRSIESAKTVAEQCLGDFIPFNRFFEMLERSDILVTATGAPHVVIGFDEMKEVMSKRGNRKLYVVDLADPPDIDGRISSLEGISYFTTSCVDELASETKSSRASAACEAWSMLEEAVKGFTWPPCRKCETVFEAI